MISEISFGYFNALPAFTKFLSLKSYLSFSIYLGKNFKRGQLQTFIYALCFLVSINTY